MLLYMIRQDFNLNKITTTTGSVGAGGQLQLIIPANVYETNSMIEIIYTGVNVANTSLICYRPEFFFSGT